MSLPNQPCNRDQIVAALRQRVRGATGYSQFELAAVERRLAHSLPADLRRLYAEFSERDLKRALGPEAVTTFAALKDLEIWRGQGLVGRELIPIEWRSAEWLRFGGTTFGDELLYCLAAGPTHSGVIAVTDHEADAALKILGRSLAHWLERLLTFNGIEPAVVPGMLADIASGDALAFARDHLRLNPGEEWAARRVYDAEHPDETRIVYWDDRTRCLRPIQELTWLDSVTLSDVILGDMIALSALTDLRRLLLSKCQFTSLQPLAALTKLQWLGIYGGPPVSVAPLAALRELRQLRTLRMQINDVGALAPIPTLDFVEITDSEFDDAVGLARITSLTKLSIPGTRVADLRPLRDLARLEYLEVNGTPVTDISPCEHMPRLRALVISRGQCPRRMLAALRAAQPKIEIMEW